jgi:hypothetical protein
MNEGEEIAADTRCLRCHHPLRRHRGDGGVDGVATAGEKMSTGLGRQIVW